MLIDEFFTDNDRLSDFQMAVLDHFKRHLDGDFYYVPISNQIFEQSANVERLNLGLPAITSIDIEISEEVLHRVEELGFSLLLVPSYRPTECDALKGHDIAVLNFDPHDLASNELLVSYLADNTNPMCNFSHTLMQVESLLLSSSGEIACHKVQLAFVMLAGVVIVDRSCSVFSLLLNQIGVERFWAYFTLLTSVYRSHVQAVLCHYDGRLCEFFDES